MNNIIHTTGSTRQLLTIRTLLSKTNQILKCYNLPVRQNEVVSEGTRPTVFILEGQSQAMGPFKDSTPYQISGIGNPEIDPHAHQIRIPGIIFDQTDISMVIGVRSVFFINTGKTPVEATGFNSIRTPKIENLPHQTTLNPYESIGFRINKSSTAQVSWNSQQEGGEQHVVVRFTFDQKGQQIHGSYESQPVAHS
jgi:hypothetical protein